MTKGIEDSGPAKKDVNHHPVIAFDWPQSISVIAPTTHYPLHIRIVA